jgi:ABC-type antimicrobial peptide transport system permease subunit
LQTGTEALAEEEDQPRFLVTLMGLLAAVAVTLASLGLYGVLAYSVARRNRELGIRLALGADRRRVRRMVLAEGVAVAGAGVVLGAGAALLASRTLGQLLYEVEPSDPSTLLGTATLFLLIAAAACLVPAIRATRVDPVEVLKAE